MQPVFAWVTTLAETASLRTGHVFLRTCPGRKLRSRRCSFEALKLSPSRHMLISSLLSARNLCSSAVRQLEVDSIDSLNRLAGCASSTVKIQDIDFIEDGREATFIMYA